MGEAKRRRMAGETVAYTPKPALPVDDWSLTKAVRALYAVISPKITTPGKPIRNQVAKFCKTISVDTPVFLPFTSVSPDYTASFCHNNVLEQVRRAGGRRVCGWMVWDNGKYSEAEFHSVWVADGSETMIDLTPRADREDEILFLPDSVTQIIREGPHDLIPNSRTSLLECPYVSRGQPLSHPFSQALITADTSPFGFLSVAT